MTTPKPCAACGALDAPHVRRWPRQSAKVYRLCARCLDESDSETSAYVVHLEWHYAGVGPESFRFGIVRELRAVPPPPPASAVRLVQTSGAPPRARSSAPCSVSRRAARPSSADDDEEGRRCTFPARRRPPRATLIHRRRGVAPRRKASPS